MDLSYHPALNNPAASRYSATTPRLIKWFKRHNGRVSPEKQVWPFNFLLAFQVSTDRVLGSRHLAFDDKLHKLTKGMPRPVAPFDTDTNRAAKKCIDRETDEPVSPDLLMTYREAVANYQLHPESKFANGNPFDQGVTERQCVDAISVVCIGKEANRWEEQFYLGLDSDAQIIYGMPPSDPKQLKLTLRQALQNNDISEREIAKRTDLSRTTISKLLAGKSVRNAHELAGRVLQSIKVIIREREYDEREKARLSTVRPRDQWVDKVGGLQLGETSVRLGARVAEIERLEKLLVSGELRAEHAIELVHRRICELKGIWFDEYEPQE